MTDSVQHEGHGYNPSCRCADCNYVRNSEALDASSNRVQLHSFQPGYWLVSVDDAGCSFRLRITQEEYETCKYVHNSEGLKQKPDAIPNSVSNPGDARNDPNRDRGRGDSGPTAESIAALDKWCSEHWPLVLLFGLFWGALWSLR